MKSKYKDSHVEIKSNADETMAELARFAGDLASLQSFRGEIWTEVLYAIFVEFGTGASSDYKGEGGARAVKSAGGDPTPKNTGMLPRAMVRKSIPAIEAYFDEQWQALPAMFTKAQFEAMIERVMEFALKTIAANTPVKSGKLKGSWKGSVRFGRVTRMLGIQ